MTAPYPSSLSLENPLVSSSYYYYSQVTKNESAELGDSESDSGSSGLLDEKSEIFSKKTK